MNDHSKITGTDFENVQRILENAPVKRPNGDGEIHPLSGLLFCKECGAKMHIRIDYRNNGNSNPTGRRTGNSNKQGGGIVNDLLPLPCFGTSTVR